MTNEELLVKIREEIERLYKSKPYSEDHWNLGYDRACEDMMEFLIDLEEQAKYKVHNPIFDECVANVDQKVREEVRENIDFEQALYDHFGQVKDFTLGMRIGKYFYELGCRRTAEKYDEIEYNRQRAEESVPKNLEEAAEEYAKLDEEGKWKDGGKYKGFIAGAEWQAEQFEKNRLAACDNMSKEEYDMETDFVDSIIKKEHRQPTFSDAINYGMRLQPLPEDTVIYQKGVEEGKRLMMSEAVEIGTTEIYWEPDGDRAFPTFDPPVEDLLMPDIISQRFNEGDKVRIIILKED